MFYLFFRSLDSFLVIIRRSIYLFLFLLLSGCSSIPFFGNDSDFESRPSPTKPKKLEVPPDLITPAKDRKFSIPSSDSTMSKYELSINEGTSDSIQDNILPVFKGLEIKSYGNHRVLIVDKPVEFLWPILREFWINSGFSIAKEFPEIGVLETDWFEDRRNVPKDFIKNLIGKVFNNIYDSGERDRYTMRLERVADNKTEISVAHKGLIEIAAERPDGTIKWVNKPTDRKLEEDYLKQIMLALGVGKEKTDELIAIKKSSNKVLFTSNDSSTHIKVFENFDNTWRKVGIAIDRLEFNVEDRVRSDGIYFIKYRDPTIDQKKKGFFSNLFSLGGSSNKIQVFQIKLRSEADATKIFVIDEQGEKNSVTTKSIASILFDQLR